MYFPTSLVLSSLLLSGVDAAAILGSLGSLGSLAVDSSCRAYPGSSTWPSVVQWAALNTAVSGKLDAVVPPGAICHSLFNGLVTLNTAKCVQFTADFKVNQQML